MEPDVAAGGGGEPEHEASLAGTPSQLSSPTRLPPCPRPATVGLIWGSQGAPHGSRRMVPVFSSRMNMLLLFAFVCSEVRLHCITGLFIFPFHAGSSRRACGTRRLHHWNRELCGQFCGTRTQRHTLCPMRVCFLCAQLWPHWRPWSEQRMNGKN